MELTAKTLLKLVRALRFDDQGLGKRKHPRVGLSARTKIIRASAPGKRIPISVRDVSAGGIGFSCGTSLKPGEKFTIAMPDPTGNMFSCTVAHCSSVSSDLHVIGARFNDFPPAG